jgi:hypothetical protein
VRKKRPQYDDLLNCLTYDGMDLGAFQIVLADVGKNEVKIDTWRSDLSVVHFGTNDAWDRTLSDEAVRQIKTLPKEDVQVRILVLELALRQQSSSRAIIDAIRSTYDVDPVFLNAFYCYNRNGLDFE